jgi:hypothetical protein
MHKRSDFMKKVFELKAHGTIDANTYSSGWKLDGPPVLDSECVMLDGLYLIPILDFHLTGLRGTKIQKASLTLKVVGEDYPFIVEVSSISQPWNPEHASLFFADRGVRWVHEKWFTDVIMTHGHSMHFKQEVAYDPQSKIVSIEIPSELIYAMINGQSYGLALLDYKSKAYYSDRRSHLIKKFNVDASKGIAPLLEIEYDQASFDMPPCISHLKAEPLNNDESFEYAGAKLEWPVPPAPKEDEYRYYNLYYVEKSADSDQSVPIESMNKVEKAFVPNHTAGNQTAEHYVSTEVHYLKPETAYLFAVTTANNGCESSPVYAQVKTLGVPQRPLVQIDTAEKPHLPSNPYADSSSFRVYILDGISKANPINGNVLENDPRSYWDTGSSNLDQYNNHIFDGKTIRLRGALGEKMVFQLLVENKTDSPLKFTADMDSGSLNKSSLKMSRVWYLHCKNAWLPEAAIPVKYPADLSIPASDNNMSGQRFQAVLVELEIPSDIRSGLHSFMVSIKEGADAVSIPVEIQVEDITLSQADFQFELNGYTPVPRYMGANYGDPEYLPIEEAYYRVAYENNCMINIVPYSQFGEVYPGFAPEIKWIDGLPRVVDWSRWDEHFQRYLDGTYLEQHTGRRIPITHMYLPFFENWPMPIDEYYKVHVDTQEYPEMLNQQKLRSTTPWQDFMPIYREGIKSVLKDFIRHFDEKGWQNITFQYFFNNKENFKEKDQAKGKHGGGTCWWLLDEPVFIDDWEALAFFGSILREAQQELNSGYNIKFRIDVSRYDKIFYYLDNILDIAVLSGRALETKGDLARERRRKFGEEYWVYGGLPPIEQSAMDLCLWVIDCYVNGAKGVLPWNNYGFDRAYEIPEPTAGLYPGNRFGLNQPVVSMRLKAAKQAMELLKYLQTFKDAYGYNEIQLKDYVSHFLNLKGEARVKFEEDAGNTTFKLSQSWYLETLKNNILDRLMDKTKDEE